MNFNGQICVYGYAGDRRTEINAKLLTCILANEVLGLIFMHGVKTKQITLKENLAPG